MKKGKKNFFVVFQYDEKVDDFSKKPQLEKSYEEVKPQSGCGFGYQTKLTNYWHITLLGLRQAGKW